VLWQIVLQLLHFGLLVVIPRYLSFFYFYFFSFIHFCFFYLSLLPSPFFFIFHFLFPSSPSLSFSFLTFQQYTFPNFTGFPISRQGTEEYIKLEIHYYTPNGPPSVLDNSGFRIKYRKPMGLETGTAIVGFETSPSMTIPPGFTPLFSSVFFSVIHFDV
jgi:hypothetical protein